MKILALVTEAYGATGGIAQSNRDLLEAISGAGSEAVVLPRWKRPRFLYGIHGFATLFRRGPFDLIFCGHLFMAPLAAVLAAASRVPFWVHIHGIEAWSRPNIFIRKSVGKAVLVTAISRHTRRKFLEWSDIPPERVRVLPDTVSETFRPGPKPRRFIQSHGLEGKKILLTVGRLAATERYKGHDKVISVLSRLAGKYPDLVYVIVGEGDDRARLENLAQREGVRERVLFLGHVEDALLPDLYRAADVFVMPSTGEGFGIVYLEAVSSGLPVVADGRDGSFDALLEGRLGNLLMSDSPEELERTIEEVLVRPPREQGMGSRFSKPNFERHLNGLLHTTC